MRKLDVFITKSGFLDDKAPVNYFSGIGEVGDGQLKAEKLSKAQNLSIKIFF